MLNELRTESEEKPILQQNQFISYKKKENKNWVRVTIRK